jgi:hypothetical protein
MRYGKLAPRRRNFPAVGAVEAVPAVQPQLLVPLRDRMIAQPPETTKAAADLGFGRDWKLGAGEGIRTLDPNLGKVVLYP